jgi:oligopeptide/dipeptide ABC transporter ATP-binding protein
MSLVEARQLNKNFTTRNAVLQAVKGINLTINKGEILGLVGESGCGKSTLGRLLLSLYKPTSGQVFFQGRDLASLSAKQKLALRKQMQTVFQDPYSSLNPLMRIEKILTEPLEIHRIGTAEDQKKRAYELLELVDLDLSFLHKYPHQCSGGQRQRIGIARALATSPDFLVLDEPVSALDAHTQLQIMRLFASLKQKLQFTCLFITHDLGILRHFADRIAVMYAGQIVECAPTKSLFENPFHPYSKALLSCIPSRDLLHEQNRQRMILKGDPANPLENSTGCQFASRCPQAMLQCRTISPVLQCVDRSHEVSCLLDF